MIAWLRDVAFPHLTYYDKKFINNCKKFPYLNRPRADYLERLYSESRDKFKGLGNEKK